VSKQQPTKQGRGFEHPLWDDKLDSESGPNQEMNDPLFKASKKEMRVIL
jgi:hypothetical protein